MNILLVSHSFAPLNKISSLRMVHWVKYWLKHNHSVTVLTTKKYEFDGPLDLPLLEQESLTVIEVDYIKYLSGDNGPSTKHRNGRSYQYEAVKKLVLKARGVIGSLFDIHDLWIPGAVHKGKIVLDDRKFDLIISSYAPPCSHIVASRLAKTSKVKWIADYRDLWSDNHIGSSIFPFSVVERFIENRSVGKYASSILTVSKPLARTLAERFSQKVAVIENGFDPSEYKGLPVACNIQEFIKGEINIVYAGTIYPGRRDPRLLLQALLLVNRKINVHFFGGDEKVLKSMIGDVGCKTAFVHGYRNREYILRVLSQANLLLMLESGAVDADGVLTGKLFEYFAVKKPVLGIGFDENVLLGQVIRESGMGECFFDDVGRLVTFLEDFEESRYVCDESFLSRYNRESQALRVLEQLS